MGDTVDAGTNGATNGAHAPAAAPADPNAALIETITAAVEARFGEWADAHAKKTGQEIARLRHRVKAAVGGGETPSGDDAGRDAPRGLTTEDLDAAMRVGQLRGQLAEAQMQALQPLLEGRSYVEQATLLEAVTLTQAGTATRGATPATQPDARGTAPAPKTQVVYPESMTEYLQIAKTDPAQKARLDADANFHLDELPYHSIKGI